MVEPINPASPNHKKSPTLPILKPNELNLQLIMYNMITWRTNCAALNSSWKFLHGILGLKHKCKRIPKDTYALGKP